MALGGGSGIIFGVGPRLLTKLIGAPNERAEAVRSSSRNRGFEFFDHTPMI